MKKIHCEVLCENGVLDDDIPLLNIKFPVCDYGNCLEW